MCMSAGFAFVYMKRSRDGDDAIRDLDRQVPLEHPDA